jgi:hypothetical protein
VSRRKIVIKKRVHGVGGGVRKKKVKGAAGVALKKSSRKCFSNCDWARKMWKRLYQVSKAKIRGGDGLRVDGPVFAGRNISRAR